MRPVRSPEYSEIVPASGWRGSQPASETFTAGFPSPGVMVIVLSASAYWLATFARASAFRSAPPLAEPPGAPRLCC